MESVKVAEMQDFQEEMKSGTATELSKPMAFTYGDGFYKDTEGVRNNNHTDHKNNTTVAFGGGRAQS